MCPERNGQFAAIATASSFWLVSRSPASVPVDRVAAGSRIRGGVAPVAGAALPRRMAESLAFFGTSIVLSVLCRTAAMATAISRRLGHDLVSDCRADPRTRVQTRRALAVLLLNAIRHTHANTAVAA